MKKDHFVLLIALVTAIACNPGSEEQHAGTDHAALKEAVKKPASTYQDTVMINFPAAVFFYADSLQLQQFRNVSDPGVYDGTMHELYYQVRNAHKVIPAAWPGLRIVEAKKQRFLLFIKKDGSKIYIDLDQRPEPQGLFVFNGSKEPIPIDMTNLETGISFYLANP